MFNLKMKNEKSENGRVKAFSLSKKYNKLKKNSISFQIKEKNSSNILSNAGKESINSNYENYLTLENSINKSKISYSILNPNHKGIKMKGHELYDPYLLQICKSAIFREKKELPNYKDIIQKVNSEYGIENEKYNDIDSYYKKLIYKNNKNLENYINSLKNKNTIETDKSKNELKNKEEE